MVRGFVLLISVLFCISFSASAQDLSQYEKHLYIKDGDTLPYRLLLPKNYDPKKKYPLVYFLHGSGERGRDNELQLVHGAKHFLVDSIRDRYPAIVVFPQCPRESWWSNVDRSNVVNGKTLWVFNVKQQPSIAMKLAQELVGVLQESYPIDKKRIYVGGLSMGGMGTFEIVARNPKTFAAAFPICGGGDSTAASRMRKVNWWIFHGAKDDLVPPELSEQMVRALKKERADVKFTLYPEANHNSWDPAFAEKDLFRWIFSNKR